MTLEGWGFGSDMAGTFYRDSARRAEGEDKRVISRSCGCIVGRAR